MSAFGALQTSVNEKGQGALRLSAIRRELNQRKLSALTKAVCFIAAGPCAPTRVQNESSSLKVVP